MRYDCMRKNTPRIIAIVLMLCTLFSFVSVSVLASESKTVIGNAPEPMQMSQTQLQNAKSVFGTAFAFMRCVEYLGKTLKAVNAVVVASKEDKSFGTICDIAIDAFLGRKRDDDSTSGDSDNSAEYYALMSAEIKNIHKELTALDDGIEKINSSIQDLNNTIIAEGNKEYVNDFRKSYIDLANDMLDEYEQLMIILDDENSTMDSAKRDYDDLYISATRLNNMLYEYMSGSYRDDGKSIYAVMYEYVDGTAGTSQSVINERCIGFADELYATFALSQYYLMICGVYQMEYCDHYGASSYVTENEAPESLPRNSIVNSITRMEPRYENIVEGVAKYVVSCGNYNMNMFYVPDVTGNTHSLTYSNLGHKLYSCDRYYFSSSFPKEYEEMFLDTPLSFDTSDTALATVGENNEIVLTGATGTFTLNMKYGERVIADYTFNVVEPDIAHGYGIDRAPYLVSSAEELNKVAKISNSHIKLISNINLGGATYNDSVFHGTFSGTFDGNGYSITNAVIQEYNSERIGFFAYLSSSAVVKNLTLQGVTVKKGSQHRLPFYFGVLCAYNTGRIYNCTTENCTILFYNFTTSNPMRSYVGGLVGYNSGGIENCMTNNFHFDSNQVQFNYFLINDYIISIGGLAGSSPGGLLKNNLVKRPYISYRATFRDMFRTSTPVTQQKNSIGLVVGDRRPSDTEALVLDGNLVADLRGEIYLTSTTYVGVSSQRYEAVSVMSVSNPENYRVIASGYNLDRDVYSELVIGTPPANTNVSYGDNLDLHGMVLLMKHASGMPSIVPFSYTSTFDPYQLGEQTVTVYYNVGNNYKTLSADLTITVVCTDHEWELDTVIVEPSCTTDGSVKNVCTICGKTDIVEVAGKNGHDYVASVTAPTCLAGGYTTHTCSRCSSSYVDTPTAAKGHTPGAAANCTAPQTCTVCDAILVPSLGHTPGASATCTTDQKCTVCDVTLVAAISHKPGTPATCESDQTCTVCGTILAVAMGHNYAPSITKPSCLEQGYTTHSCTRCDSSYRDTYTDAKGHTPGTATCEGEGKCTVCGTITSPALGHNYTATVIQPTCLEKGYTKHSCTRCDSSYNDTYTDAKGHTPGAAASCVSGEKCTICGATTTPALGHDYSSVVTHPTCLAQGYTTYSCKRCNYTCVDDYTPAKGHAPGAPASCESSAKCTACGTVTENALGHNYRASLTQPTCIAQGYTTYSCTRCSSSYVSDYTDITAHTPGYTASCETPERCTVCGVTLTAALGHNYIPEVTAPTCLAQGYTTYSCDRCEARYVTDYTPTVEHTPGTAPTCESAETCTVCGVVLNSSLGHSYTTAVTAPTCLAQGYTTYTCQRCLFSYTADYTSTSEHTPGDAANCTSSQRCTLCSTVLESALGHSYLESVTPPTCTEQGYSTFDCIRCDSQYVDNYTSPVGHTPGDAASCDNAQKCTVCESVIRAALGHDYEAQIIPATCLSKGFTMHTCTRCQSSYNDSFKDKTDHTPGGWIVDTPAAVGVGGTEHVECTVCRVVLEARETDPLLPGEEENTPSDGTPDNTDNGNKEDSDKLKVWQIVLISCGSTVGSAGLCGVAIFLFKRKFG